MYKIIVTNSFSISMLPPTDKMGVLVEFRPISAETVRSWCNQNNVDVVSAIGHADTARIVSGLLGVELPANRISVKMTGMESLVVAQYSGSRLPEGATTLPEGAKVEFWEVSLAPWQ